MLEAAREVGDKHGKPLAGPWLSIRGNGLRNLAVWDESQVVAWIDIADGSVHWAD
jgi:hypothetical protein